MRSKPASERFRPVVLTGYRRGGIYSCGNHGVILTRSSRLG
jgi:hypothetical protein